MKSIFLREGQPRKSTLSLNIKISEIHISRQEGHLWTFQHFYWKQHVWSYCFKKCFEISYSCKTSVVEKYVDLAKPKSGAVVSLFSSPSLYWIKTIIKLFSTGCRRVPSRGFRDQFGGWGRGRELTRSGTWGRWSHNLQSDQNAC